MKHLTASTSPSPFSGENWFDPLEDAIRFRVRAFIEAVVAEEAQAALGGRARYQRSGAPKGYRNGHRHRQLVGTFGALTVSLPRVRLLDGDGGEKEWRSQTIQAYKRLTKRAEAIIAVNGGAKLVHPGGAKLVHLTLCGTRCWGVCPGSP